MRTAESTPRASRPRLGAASQIGQNRSGESTLLEAIAIAARMPPEGGSSNFALPDQADGSSVAKTFAFSYRASHTELASAVQLVRGARRPRTDFFLRAESLFVAAAYLEQLLGDWLPTAVSRCTSNRTASGS